MNDYNDENTSYLSIFWNKFKQVGRYLPKKFFTKLDKFKEI